MGWKYRLTTYFSGFNAGWTENHIVDSTAESPGAVGSALTTYHTNRAKLLGRGYQIDAWSVRRVANPDGAQVRGSGFLTIMQLEPSQLAANKGDPEHICGRALGTDAAGTESRQWWLGGLPDAVSGEGREMVTSAVQYGTNFAELRNWMTTNQLGLRFGWFSFTKAGEALIEGYTRVDGFAATFTLRDPILNGLPPGTEIPIRIARLNGRSVLNGAHIGVVESATTFSVKNWIAVGPYASPGNVTVYSPQPSYIQAAGWQLSARSSRHKRGRPFSASRGRLPVRPRY